MVLALNLAHNYMCTSELWRSDSKINASFVVCTCRHPFSMLASMSGIHAVGTRVLMASVSK